MVSSPDRTVGSEDSVLALCRPIWNEKRERRTTDGEESDERGDNLRGHASNFLWVVAVR